MVMNVIGLMSGTSADGVDAALVEIRGAPPGLSVREIAFLTQPYDDATRAAVLDLCRPDAPLLALGRTHVLLGHCFAEAALAVIAQSRPSWCSAFPGPVAPTAVALIGSHGQTVYHAPGGDPPFTLQIGDPAVIAARTGIPTVADFRAADVAAGGQGAPLVPYPDWLMWHQDTCSRALQNIGGIANVTYLPSGGGPESVIAFDTGPGNVLIDAVAARASDGASRYDRNGTLAAQGDVDETLLSHLLDHPYLRQPPPKSTGRETFGADFAAGLWRQAEASGLSPADLAATVTAFTAASIADAYRRWLPTPIRPRHSDGDPVLPDEVFLCGGGADNPVLVRMIRDYLARAFGEAVPVVRHYDETGYSSAAKEAVAFAILAYETWHGRPGNLPQVTGASRPAILGHVTRPPHSPQPVPSPPSIKPRHSDGDPSPVKPRHSDGDPVVRHYDETGYSSAAKETAAFAIPAYETWHGRPGNLPLVSLSPCPLVSLSPRTAHIAPDGHLWIAGHDAVELAEEYGTPLYLYDGATFRHRLAELRDALARHYPGPARVAYAAKACFTPGLARRLQAVNVGLDVVSGGEMALAREAGFDPARVHLHGNNKSLDELQSALDWGIGRIVVDSLDELEWLDALVAEQSGGSQSGAIGKSRLLERAQAIWLRLTPGLDVKAHPYRKTGHAASKFGLHMAGPDCPAAQALARARESAWLDVTGLHTHLGSQIFDPAAYVAAIKCLLDFAAAHRFVPAELSPGGGWGVPYAPSEWRLCKDSGVLEGSTPPVQKWIAAVSRAIVEACQARDWPLPYLVVEPGRWLIAPAAVALYSVGTRKVAADGTRYVAVDGGMADNPRPALYGARYTAFLANRALEPPDELVTIVGRFCESGDVLVRDVRLPHPRPGDLLAIPVAGAYQLSMASRYNLAPAPVALWLEEGNIAEL